MQKDTNIRNRLQAIPSGLLMAMLIGMLAYAVTRWLRSPIADPLVMAMIVGVIVRTAVGNRTALHRGFALAPSVFIPIGIVFYGMKNLNFVRFAETQPRSLFLPGLVLMAYFVTILVLGRLLGQRDRIGYLAAAGSAICGASAIAITSPSIEADPDDISISILAVTMAALVALFTFLPFVAATLEMNDRSFGLLSGSVLQITGFVKAAVMDPPFVSRQLSDEELVSFALSIKAARYMGLLIAIPLFASLVHKRFCIPWVLWVFLGAGLLGTWLCATHRDFYTAKAIPVITPIYGLSWSIAMAAVGLNADARKLLSDNGAKALVMAFAGCIAAIVTFIAGSTILGQS